MDAKDKEVKESTKDDRGPRGKDDENKQNKEDDENNQNKEDEVPSSQQPQQQSTKYNYYKDTVSGYVQSISKTNHSKRKNCDFFNAVLQTNSGTFSELVCLSPEKKGVFEEAAKNRSPLKFSNVYCSPSKLKRFDSIVKYGRPSNEEETSVEFEYTDAPPRESVPDQPTMNIADITLICDFVSVKGYINIDNRPVTKVQLPYMDDPVEKREAWINDNTGGMRLDLWGDHVRTVSSSGAYHLINAKVKSMDKLTLTTNRGSRLSLIADTDLQPSQIPSKEKTCAKKFPPSKVVGLKRRYYCTDCNKFRDSASSNPNLFSCSICGAARSPLRLKKRMSCLLVFEEDHEVHKIKFGGLQFDEYFSKMGAGIPNDLDEISIQLLQDCNTVIIYDSQNFCIGFKQ